MLRKLYQKLMSKHTSGENTLGKFLLIAWHTLLECTRPLLASRLATQHLFRMASHKNTLHSDSTQDFHKRLQGSKTTEPYKPVFYKLLRITYHRGYISPISVVGVRLRLEVVEPIQHPFCKCYLCLILQCTAYCSHFFFDVSGRSFAF